jgi:hypothetical protein
VGGADSILLVVDTINVEGIWLSPGCLEFKWYSGLFVGNSVGFKVSEKVSVGEQMLYRVWVNIPMFVRHNEDCDSGRILLG